MTEEETAFGKRLIAATSDIIGRLDPTTINGAVNWGDLDCVSAEKVESMDAFGNANMAWRVIVEEAAPSAYELGSAIHTALAAEGFKNVEVHLDW